jgi:hypothetical protein
MKNLKNIKVYLVLSLLIISVSAFNIKSTNSYIAYDPSGIWDYTVPSDEGDITGEMTIANDDGDWQITIESDIYGTLELEDVTLEENKEKEVFMDGNVDIEGDVIEFYFEFDDDSLEGVVGTPDGDMDITAERQKK